MLNSQGGWSLACAAVVACVVGGGATERAQSPEQFDVASIVANTTLDAARGMRLESGNSLVATGMTLRDLIWSAYGADKIRVASQIVGGPGWVTTDRYDIRAKGPAGSTAEATSTENRRTLAMLGALLEDRFKLRVHFEQREGDAYLLVAARRDGSTGPALRKSSAVCAAADWSAPPGSERWCGIRVSNRELMARGFSMVQLAATLGSIPLIGRPVQDNTGLAGGFDFHMEFAPADAADAADKGTIFTALQEQLGLKLQVTTAPVDILVIDAVARPTAN